MNTNTVVWQPKAPETSKMARFMKEVNQRFGLTLHDYETLHTWSIDQPQDFWRTLCDFCGLHFNTPPTEIISSPAELIDTQWFKGATFNFAEKLLSRHDDHPALICLNEQGQRRVVTFRMLHDKVGACAHALKAAGIVAGDRVVGVLPNDDHTVIAMLATTSLGAIWSSCSPDFGAEAITDRLSQIEPSLLFIADHYHYNGKRFDLSEKIKQIRVAIHTIKKTVICSRETPLPADGDESGQVRWDDFTQTPQPLTCTPFDFDHPLYILFSSGTTGKPKCILHGAGGTLIEHLRDLVLHTDLSAHDTLFFYTTCGWMMWNWMVSALCLGTTIVLYDGSPTHPTMDHFFDIVEQEHVSVFGTSAKYLSTIQHAMIHPNQTHPFTHLHTILSTGSPLLPVQYDFVRDHISSSAQLASISGGTDIVSCFALGNPMQPVYRGELQCIGLGMRVKIFNEQGESITQGIGELVCTQAFPSMPLRFWNDPERTKYRHAYFERFNNVWTHGDFAELTSHHGLIIHGRSDTTLNPGGVRIGTAEIYRQIEKIPEVLDSVVIAQNWHDDVRIILFVTLQPNAVLNDALIETIRHTIRAHASPRHVPAKIIAVPDIPRTINGKTVELAVRQAVHNQPVPQLGSWANPEALTHFKNRKELLDD